MPAAKDLRLYQFDACGYCARVRSAIERLGLDVEIRQVDENLEYRREVIEATGRETVPVLRIEDSDGGVRWMPESREIIAYLNERFGR